MSSKNPKLPHFFYPPVAKAATTIAASSDDKSVFVVSNGAPNVETSKVGRKNNKQLTFAYSNPGFDGDENEPEKHVSRLSRKKLNKQLSSLQSEISHQKFSEQQKKKLRSFSSANYTPAHSITYVRWIKIHRSSLIARLDLDRWFLILFIGVLIGLVAALLKQCISGLSAWQWSITRGHINNGSIGKGFAYLACTNAVMVFVGAVLVVFIHPMAMGGGAPEIIAFLNGIRIHEILTVKNLVTKFSANILAVGTGLPAAIQGPLITYGAIIGAGVGQFQSAPFNLSPSVFSRFRNAEDRRAFTTSGVAAGVSAGFNSPIGGLLFAMEDLSSHWSRGLSWQTFFCCVVATTVTQLFNTAFTSFKYRPPFGFFHLSVVLPIRLHVTIIFPALLLGFIGGLLGVVFTKANVFIAASRTLVLSKIKSEKTQQLIRVIEPCILVVLMTTYTVFLPLGFPCKTPELLKGGPENKNYSVNLLGNLEFISYGNCEDLGNESNFNPMASLIQGSSYLDMLWSRSTYYAFDYSVCLCAFVIYFPLTIWTASSAIAGGIFVPVLISGSLIGRALGIGLIQAHRAATGSLIPSEMFTWLDPGLLAAVGAAALLSGVNRLEVASTVIVIEMVGDINLVVPVLISIFVSKTVASKLSKALYKYQLEAKAFPFLDSDPQIVIQGKISNMELWRAKDIMASPVMVIESDVSVHKVSRLLLDTKHSSFPVVKFDVDANFEVVHGIITRNELYSILTNDDVYTTFHENNIVDYVIEPKIPYEELDSHTVTNLPRIIEILKSYTMKKDISTKINLDLFISMSVTKVDQNFSLLRTYRLFRVMGLRQLLVIDSRNKPVGIITRKDLMQFNIQENLEKLIGQEIPEETGSSIYLSVNKVSGRRLSRKFSIEEGSILGTIMLPPDLADKDEVVIEVPAVTKVMSKMETISEEDHSSNDDNTKRRTVSDAGVGEGSGSDGGSGRGSRRVSYSGDGLKENVERCRSGGRVLTGNEIRRQGDGIVQRKKSNEGDLNNNNFNNNNNHNNNINVAVDVRNRTNNKQSNNINSPPDSSHNKPPPYQTSSSSSSSSSPYLPRVIPTIVIEDEDAIKQRMQNKLNHGKSKKSG